jgi:hypothetical protein
MDNKLLTLGALGVATLFILKSRDTTTVGTGSGGGSVFYEYSNAPILDSFNTSSVSNTSSPTYVYTQVTSVVTADTKKTLGIEDTTSNSGIPQSVADNISSMASQDSALKKVQIASGSGQYGGNVTRSDLAPTTIKKTSTSTAPSGSSLANTVAVAGLGLQSSIKKDVSTGSVGTGTGLKVAILSGIQKLFSWGKK